MHEGREGSGASIEIEREREATECCERESPNTEPLPPELDEFVAAAVGLMPLHCNGTGTEGGRDAIASSSAL